jgi:fructokinase
VQELQQAAPAWFYFGSLFAATAQGRRTLERLLEALDSSVRFLDLNLRPGADDPTLVLALLQRAHVVKLNESELERVHELTDLPLPVERFCSAAIERFGWRALAVTLGHRGCAIQVGDRYAEAPARTVVVVDTVGAGDAFAAACLHGLSQHWPADRIAVFANGRAAEVAAHAGALPVS